MVAPNDLILVQDPARNTQYAIPLADLDAFEANQATWARISASTVTLVIPSKDSVDVTPPFLRRPADEPSVLIQDQQNQKSHFLDFADLAKYRTDRVFQPDDYAISFLLPVGLEFIHELPRSIRELQQTSEGKMVARDLQGLPGMPGIKGMPE